MKKYLEEGEMGYYGYFMDDINNVVIMKINELVDEYNQKINSFDIELENDNFYKEINNKIRDLYKKINKN